MLSNKKRFKTTSKKLGVSREGIRLAVGWLEETSCYHFLRSQFKITKASGFISLLRNKWSFTVNFSGKSDIQMTLKGVGRCHKSALGMNCERSSVVRRR
jgi:hypothetical protein